MNARGLMVTLESLISVGVDPFHGICYWELSLKNHCVGGRDRTLIAGVWMVAWSRKYWLGPAEITSFMCLILFKDGEHRVEDTGWDQDFIFLFLMLIKGMRRRDEFKFLCVTPGTEGFFLDLLRAAKNRVCALKVGCGGVIRPWVCGIYNRRLI